MRNDKVGKIRNNQSGFSAVETVLILVIVVLIGVVGFMVYRNQNKKSSEDKPVVSAKSEAKTESKPESKTAEQTFDQERVKRIRGFDTASSTFKAALVGKFYDEVTAALPCLDTESNIYISVSKMVRDDFALAQYCTSGGTSIFAKTEAGWARVGSLAMGAPACSVVDQYKISKEIDSKCLLDDGSSREVTNP